MDSQKGKGVSEETHAKINTNEKEGERGNTNSNVETVNVTNIATPGPTSSTSEKREDKLQRCVREKLEFPKTEIPKIGEGEELIGFLNCHIFEGTYVGTFYKKIVYEDKLRAEAIVRHILESGASVFMLAEVWGSAIRDSIIRGVKHEYPYSYFPQNSVILLDSGLVFLSKKRIVNMEFVTYNMLSGWDRGSNKCIAYIVTEDKTAYFTTHFNAGGDPKGKSCRQDNIKQMLKFYDEKAAERRFTRAVITGDFNIRETDFHELQNVSDREKDPEARAGWLTRKRQDYLNIESLMEARGLLDGLRLAHPDHLEHPCITADHMYNSLAVLWTPNDKTRSRLDYVFVKGFEVKDSGAYFHWWAGEDPDNVERQNEAFAMASEGPKKGRLVPVSDHYGIWIVVNKKAQEQSSSSSSSPSSVGVTATGAKGEGEEPPPKPPKPQYYSSK